MILRIVVFAMLAISVIVYGEDRSVSVVVNPKKVVNYISKEFVCFSAKPRNVFEDSLNPVGEKSFQMARSLGPMYLKVFGDSSQLELQMSGLDGKSDDSSLVQITPNGWRAFNDWAQQAGVIPVFVLDYSGESWKPKSALKMLMVASKLGIKNCLWQLGSANITDAVKYVEDLRAFQAIVKAFNFWGIVASDVDPAIAGVEQSRFFNLNVDDIADAITVNYEPLANDFRLKQFVLHRESNLRGPTRSQLPIWLDVKLPEPSAPTSFCDQTCLREGLRYATLLGDAARNGFDAVFKSLAREEIQTYSFNYLVALLHRTTVGTKVFDVPSSADEDTQIYAYCSRNANGSLTLMVVNHLPEKIQYDIKLNLKQFSAEIRQFIATAINGQIMLNGEALNFSSSLEPYAKIRPLLKSLQLDMPASSIGFWMIPNLNVRECFEDYQDLRTKFVRSASQQESSVDQLLQELIAERAQQDITQLSRRKRSPSNDLQKVSLGKMNKGLQKRGAKISARKPRQTKNYRRKQRVVRKKEKRTERRNLIKQKRPLRERGKRQLLKKNRRVNRLIPKVTSKKTKRSFLAEEVHQPPMFGNSREEEMNRSSFPQGDVHLVISKGSEDYLSVEEPPFRQERTKKSRKKKMPVVKTSSEKDLRYMVPEMAMSKDPKIPKRQYPMELDMAGSMNVDHYLPLNNLEEYEFPPKELSVDRELIEVRNIKVITPESVPENEATSTTTIEPTAESEVVDSDSFYHEPEEEDSSTTSAVTPAAEQIQDSLELIDESEVDLATDNPEFDLSMLSDDDESEEVAHVEELVRRKRSVNSSEIDRIEAFFMNNTRLQQKFAEMFDMLLESFDCCGELDENTAREESEEKAPPVQQLERTKRNALLHPESWESRERSNLLHQQRTSGESRENMVPTESIADMKKFGKQEYNDRLETSSGKSDRDDPGRPGALMLRSVTNFLKGMTTEFNRVFSNLFPQTSTV